MKLYSRLSAFVLILCLGLLPFGLLSFTGCKATLEGGGAYAPVDAAGNPTQRADYEFFMVESSFSLAYAVVDAAFAFEKNNRQWLWELSPDVKHGLDRIRPEAVKARDTYIKARKAYLASPVPSNLTAMKTALARIQQLANAASAVLPAQ